MHVLIAEARPSTRAALRALLEHDPHCHRISEATDAQGTLAALSDAPDLLLLDWALPGLPSAAVVARAHTLRPELVIIALGHHAATRRAALDVGVDCFIDTNQPPTDLIALLNTLCPDKIIVPPL
jgi:DNA-binding NarL/FixJ family response regulator